jgi:hypothetical protein
VHANACFTTDYPNHMVTQLSQENCQLHDVNTEYSPKLSFSLHLRIEIIDYKEDLNVKTHLNEKKCLVTLINTETYHI